MIRRDLPEVLAIEAASFDCPWLEEDFLHVLRQRNCIAMIAEEMKGDYRLLGFMIYLLSPGQIDLLDFAVAPKARRIGVGSAMISKLARKLNPGRRTRIVLETRETNLGAQLFFRQFGFKATEVLRGRYDDTGEDAFVMELGIE